MQSSISQISGIAVSCQRVTSQSLPETRSRIKRRTLNSTASIRRWRSRRKNPQPVCSHIRHQIGISQGRFYVLVPGFSAGIPTRHGQTADLKPEPSCGFTHIAAANVRQADSHIVRVARIDTQFHAGMSNPLQAPAPISPIPAQEDIMRLNLNRQTPCPLQQRRRDLYAETAKSRSVP